MEDKRLGKKKSWFVRLLYFIGINASPEHKLHAQLKPRFFIIIGSIVGFFIVSFFGVAKYSTSPSFCKSCHIMKPYYNAWKESKHSHVACVDCHYPPGMSKTVLWKKFQAVSQVAKYVTRTYSSKPFAEIEDASCLRSGCHSTRLLKGRVISAKGIKFDHSDHIMKEKKGRNLRCSTCHSQIVVGRHVEVTYDSCYLCHFKDQGRGTDLRPIGGCLGCHELPEKTFKLGNMDYNHRNFVTNQGVSCDDCHLDVVQGQGLASQDRCFTCHNEPEKLKQYRDIPSLHDNHVTKHNVACFHCHQEIRHGFDAGNGKAHLAGLLGDTEQTDDPKVGREAAHSRKTLVQCSHCHIGKHAGQLAIYSGKIDSLDIDMPEMPSPMYVAHVDCVGCHYQESTGSENLEFNGKTFAASDKACVKCHGSTFKGIWKKTKSTLETTLALLSEKIELADAALKASAMPGADLDKLRSNLAKVKRWHNFLKASKGEHNIYLASWIVRQEDKLLSEIEAGLKTEFSDLSTLPLVSGRYCSTLCHFKVRVKSPPVTVKAFGRKMSHLGHTVMRSCVECHVIGAHKDVKLQKDVANNVCAECHDFAKGADIGDIAK